MSQLAVPLTCLCCSNTRFNNLNAKACKRFIAEAAHSSVQQSLGRRRSFGAEEGSYVAFRNRLPKVEPVNQGGRLPDSPDRRYIGRLELS